jgi:CRP/FNR family transcriptional regulator
LEVVPPPEATGAGAAKSPCTHCPLRDLMPQAPGTARGCAAGAALVQRRLKAGQRLYRQGEPLQALYAVRSGCLKSSLNTMDGREQVNGFHLAGALMGMDGLADGLHASTATALEDTLACGVSHEWLTQQSGGHARWQRMLTQHMSREIVREHQLLLLLGTMSASERLATFLVGLSRSLTVRGDRADRLYLPMTRSDIGSYLGLKLETICRNLAAFQKQRLLEVDRRHIHIIDPAGLARASEPDAGC